MDYIVISLGCIMALLIYFSILLNNELLTEDQKKGFAYAVATIIVEIILDTISIGIDGKLVKFLTLHKGLKIIEFMIAPIIPALFAYIITRRSYWNRVKKYFVLLISLNASIQLYTFYRPIMFSIGKDAIYSRTQFTYGYLLVLFICIILLIIASKHTYIQNTFQTTVTVCATSLFISFGVLIRIMRITVNADWLFITFSYFIILIYFKDNYLKIDSTTKLLNRMAFDNKMKTVRYSTAIIVIDANNFKLINDTFRHRKGDRALRKIAEIIFSIYNKIGFCYRIGGDEFCVILKKMSLRKLMIQIMMISILC